MKKLFLDPLKNTFSRVNGDKLAQHFVEPAAADSTKCLRREVARRAVWSGPAAGGVAEDSESVIRCGFLARRAIPHCASPKNSQKGVFQRVLLFVIILFSACSSQPPLFSGDPSASFETSLSSLPEDQEIRIQGLLEKNFSKTGSHEYRVNGVWLTFDDDLVSAEDFVGKTVMVKGTVHHFNNCPPKQDPDMPEQCAIAEQLRVIDLR